MQNTIYQSQVITMEKFDNLFIEMTAKCCNQRCKNCYIEIPQYKKIEDFISIDMIKNALEDTKNEKIKCTYLTGAEPMTHPDFNTILRLCLKKTNVCICTNGSYINEKKARFLRKVSDENNNELIFKISMDHYEEVKNDNVRYHGAYRQALFAIKNLIKYNFIPIITVTNYYNEDKNILFQNFFTILEKQGMILKPSHFQINPPYDKNNTYTDEQIQTIKSDINPDCKNGRILTSKGIYTCPFLAGDYRGRCGKDFNDFTKKCALEANFCQTCATTKKPIFGIDFSQFE